MAAPLQKSGEKPDKSGEYVERGPRGGEIPKPRHVTIEPGDSPCTRSAGCAGERGGIAWAHGHHG